MPTKLSSQRNDESTRQKTTVCAADQKQDEVSKGTDRQARTERHRQPRSTSSPREKEGGILFDPQKSDDTTDNAAQNLWSNYDQLQPAPPTLKWMGSKDRAARPKTWGGGRLHRHIECGAPATPEDTPSGATATGGGRRKRSSSLRRRRLRDEVSLGVGRTECPFPLPFPFVSFSGGLVRRGLGSPTFVAGNRRVLLENVGRDARF